jgi:Tol biopolymer transport system component
MAKPCHIFVLGLVLALLAAPTAEASFPGVPGQIAFSRDDPMGIPQVWVIGPETGFEIQLTSGDANRQPGFDPSGLKIAFVSRRDGGDEVYVMGADGTDATRITATSSDKSFPAWTPTKARIVFEGPGGNPMTGDDLFRVNDDTTGLVPLITNPGDDGLAELSADGELMVFQSETAPGNTEIFAADPDGGAQRQLTINPSEDGAPTISPDGRLIAFQSERDGNPEIYLMKADGTGQVRLTYDASADTAPTFSPDGTAIAFVSTRDDPPTALQPRGNVYAIAPDGSGLRRITANTTRENTGSPDWQPIPQHCTAHRATQVGTAGPDQLLGTAGKDVIVGLGGADVISGLGGKDRLCGGTGNDRLKGQGGRDRLIGEAGRDRMRGGKALDRCAGGRGRDRAKGCELRFKI